ncbi:MAG: hypothetical protein AABW73_05160 [Nanoarchaeota archaeon]
MEQKFLLSLKNADKSLRMADHLACVTYPLLLDNKIFLQIISELNIFSIYMMNSVLQYEYYFKRIQLFTDAKINFETFKNDCVKYYGFTDKELSSLYEVMRLGEAHKNSPMEFVKGSNVVIMSDGMRTDTINIDKIKLLMTNLKSMLAKVRARLQQSRLF